MFERFTEIDFTLSGGALALGAPPKWITMEINSPNKSEYQPRPQISLWKIFTSYFIVGLTAFGMAILQKLKALVMDNAWLSEEEMNDGLAMVQLYPGPLMVDFTALWVTNCAACWAQFWQPLDLSCHLLF